MEDAGIGAAPLADQVTVLPRLERVDDLRGVGVVGFQQDILTVPDRLADGAGLVLPTDH